MVRPERIKSIRLFEDDRRVDGGKFLFLNVPIQPMGVMGTDGSLIRPGMIEDEIQNVAGNVGLVDFPDAFEDGQVWVIDHVGFLNGGAAAKLVGMVLDYEGNLVFLGSDAAVGIGAPQEFLTQPFHIDAQVGIQVIVGGAALDTYSIHARRVA